jgi:hypothetical protein
MQLPPLLGTQNGELSAVQQQQQQQFNIHCLLRGH